MAQIVTLPTASPTGYGQLGQVLMGAAADYAGENRRSADEARVRANQLEDAARNRGNQLADVESTRAYNEKRYGVERGDKIKDTEAEKVFAGKMELMRLGYLTPDKFDDAAAVQSALTKMQSVGLLQRYQGALQSGDLTYGDLSSGDEKKINAGLAKFSERLGKETSRQETSVGAAQDTANSLQAQYDQSLQQASSLEQSLSRPVEEMLRPPSQSELQNLALQLAQQNTGGKPPSAKDIAAQIPVAQQQLQQRQLEGLMLQKQQTQERVRLLKDQAQSLGVRLNTLANRGVFPVSKPVAASPLDDVTAAPAPTIASPDARRTAMQATIAGARGTPAAGATAAAVPSPVSAPVAAPAPVNPFLADVTEPAAQYNPATGGLLATAHEVQNGRRTDKIRDFFKSVGQDIWSLRPQRINPGDVGANGLVTDVSSPAMRAEHIAQLKARLASLTERGTALEADLRFQLQKLEQLDAQAQTKDAQSAQASPVSDVSQFLPAAAIARPNPWQGAPPSASNANGTTPFPGFNSTPAWWSAAKASGF